MLADFQGDGRWCRVNNGEKGRERKCKSSRAGFRTCERMQSSPVAESGLWVARNFSTFLDAKNRVQGQFDMTGKNGYLTKREGLGTQYLEANTQLRYSAFS